MSDDTDIDKILLDAAVKSPVNVGNKLTLSKNTEHIFHKIYVRYDYVQIWNKISSSKTTRFFITGSSGIGKSCFIGYIIVELLKSKDYKIIIYSELRHGAGQPDYYVITKDYIKLASNLFIHTLLTTKPIEGLRVMWLMDAMQHGPYQCLNKNVTVILFASFSEKNYKDFNKHCGRIPVMMYLPWWSQTDEGHLVGLYAEHFNNPPEPIECEFFDLVNLYCTDDTSGSKFEKYAKCWTIAGCNPRSVLQTQSIKVLEYLITVKSTCIYQDLRLLTLAFAGPQRAYITDTENFSSEIFCPVIDRKHYLPTGNVIYVSQFACDMLTKCFKSKEYNEQIDYLVAWRISEDSSKKWRQSFESHMHFFFLHCRQRSFTITKLNPQFSHCDGVPGTEILTLPSFDRIKRFTEIEHDLNPNTYYQPFSPRFTSVDSFYLDTSGALHVFQFTTSTRHQVIAQGLYSVVGTKYNEVKLIFVVPSDKYRLPGQQSIKNMQSLTNIRTKFYEPLQEDILHNLSTVVTQWKLVVDIDQTRNVLF